MISPGTQTLFRSLRVTKGITSSALRGITPLMDGTVVLLCLILLSCLLSMNSRSVRGTVDTCTHTSRRYSAWGKQNPYSKNIKV